MWANSVKLSLRQCRAKLKWVLSKGNKKCCTRLAKTHFSFHKCVETIYPLSRTDKDIVQTTTRKWPRWLGVVRKSAGEILTGSSPVRSTRTEMLRFSLYGKMHLINRFYLWRTNNQMDCLCSRRCYNIAE